MALIFFLQQKKNPDLEINMLENKSLSFSFIFYLKKNRSGRPGHLPKQVTRLDTYSLMKVGELLFK
jgi:hypothetical protein